MHSNFQLKNLLNGNFNTFRCAYYYASRRQALTDVLPKLWNSLWSCNEKQKSHRELWTGLNIYRRLVFGHGPTCLHESYRHELENVQKSKKHHWPVWNTQCTSAEDAHNRRLFGDLPVTVLSLYQRIHLSAGLHQRGFSSPWWLMSCCFFVDSSARAKPKGSLLSWLKNKLLLFIVTTALVDNLASWWPRSSAGTFFLDSFKFSPMSESSEVRLILGHRVTALRPNRDVQRTIYALYAIYTMESF